MIEEKDKKNDMLNISLNRVELNSISIFSGKNIFLPLQCVRNF